MWTQTERSASFAEMSDRDHGEGSSRPRDSDRDGRRRDERDRRSREDRQSRRLAGASDPHTQSDLRAGGPTRDLPIVETARIATDPGVETGIQMMHGVEGGNVSENAIAMPIELGTVIGRILGLGAGGTGRLALAPIRTAKRIQRITKDGSGKRDDVKRRRR